MYGTVDFGPVLGSHQSALLGLCAERPALGPRGLVLVFDQGMSDGMRAAAFLMDCVSDLKADSKATSLSAGPKTQS